MRSALRKASLVLAGLGLCAGLSGCDDPPAESTQTGYRGTGMVQIADAERVAALMAANQVPAPPYDLEPIDGPLASEAYENVQVLGHLPESQFLRLMTAITEWVSPEEGCGYCHNLENLASDEVYTKVVSRRMLQMTWQINDTWSSHVADTGNGVDVSQIDLAEGFDDVYLESLDSPMCLRFGSTELGVTPVE